MNNQLPALTSLRGIAAIFILLHHVSIYFFPEIGKLTGQFTPFFRKSYLWVDFFFMLSGFTLMHVYSETFETAFSSKKYKAFMISRFVRIYPLHLLLLLCFVGLACFQTVYHAGPGFTGHQSFFSLVTNLTLLQSIHYSSWNEPAWAISAQWLLYFLVPFMIFRLQKASRAIDLAAVALSFCAIFILNAWVGHLDFVGWKSLVRCAAEMMTGILVYKYRSQFMGSRYFTAGNLTVGLMIIVLILISLPINHAVTVCIFPFLIAGASVSPASSVLNSPFLIFLGTISYSLYMIHWFFIVLFNTLSTFMTGNALHMNLTPWQIWTLLIAFIIFNIIIASLCYKHIEQPARRVLKKLLLQ